MTACKEKISVQVRGSKIERVNLNLSFAYRALKGKYSLVCKVWLFPEERNAIIGI